MAPRNDGIDGLRRAALALATIGLLAASAGAGEDAIEINRAAALAGGVTTGDTAGFPITLSEPGSYVLTGNLDLSGESDPPNTTAIEIAATGVTVDLGGFQILGTTDCSGTPVTSCDVASGSGDGIRVTSSSEEARILDGTIRGMGRYGVNCGTAELCTVLGVRAFENRLSGIQGTNGTVVRDCLSAFNGDNGIRTAFGSVVEGNVVGANGAVGVEVVNTTARVANNVVGVNGSYGMDLGTETLLTGNMVSSDFDVAPMLGGVDVADNVCCTPNGKTSCSGL